MEIIDGFALVVAIYLIFGAKFVTFGQVVLAAAYGLRFIFWCKRRYAER